MIASDAGRPISHFANNLNGVKLEKYAEKVLQDLAMQEAEVQDNDGNYYRMRIRPYRTLNNVIDGVVVTFEDITELKQLNKDRRLAAVVKDSHGAITLLDLQGNIKAWNKGAEIIYGYSESEALTMNILDIVPQDQTDEMLALLARLASKEGVVAPFVAKRLRKDGNVVRVWTIFTKLPAEHGRTKLIATTERDISLLTEDAIQHLKGKSHAK